MGEQGYLRRPWPCTTGRVSWSGTRAISRHVSPSPHSSPGAVIYDPPGEKVWSDREFYLEHGAITQLQVKAKPRIGVLQIRAR